MLTLGLRADTLNQGDTLELETIRNFFLAIVETIHWAKLRILFKQLSFDLLLEAILPDIWDRWSDSENVPTLIKRFQHYAYTVLIQIIRT